MGGETEVKGLGYQPPKSFELYANYPNPFNPSTVISFNVFKSQYVRLKIFDLEGREITTVYEGYASAGMHSMLFNASGISSGTYFYRLKGAGGIQTKKFILLK